MTDIQTWLPLPSFADSIATFRKKELKEQRLHVLELVEAFHSVSEEDSDLPYEYQRTEDLEEHPIYRMWYGYSLQLIDFGLTCCETWQQIQCRRDRLIDPLQQHFSFANTDEAKIVKPNWWGDVDFHLSHQAGLLRTDKKHYSHYFLGDVDRELEWPESDLLV